ncbi:hypothetical protein AW729_05075 [Methanosphaera sp. BMS]|nr:hypothetical protein AW729_05075 [Methanosphaera sp. BMS]
MVNGLKQYTLTKKPPYNILNNPINDSTNTVILRAYLYLKNLYENPLSDEDPSDSISSDLSLPFSSMNAAIVHNINAYHEKAGKPTKNNKAANRIADNI